MRFIVPAGIGDSLWALMKAQDVSAKIGDGVVDVYVASRGSDKIENRALPFLRRFRFVNEAKVLACRF